MYRTAAFLALLAAGSVAAHADDVPLKVGDSVKVGTQTVVVKSIDALPFVDSEYTRRFKFDSFDNPKLKELREKYQLSEVVAPGKTEFEQQVILMDWVNNKFPKFGTPSSKARGALSVLQAVEEGHTFFCAHYADVLVSSAASLGWIDRPLALKRPNKLGDWASEHSSTEIWSNQFKKWVLLDPTYNVYVEKNGIPLSAYETRQEWFYNNGADMDIFIGTDRTKHKKSEMPIFRRHYEGFGDIKVNPTTFYFYGFIGYIPGNSLMDRNADLNLTWIFKDKFGEGTSWHTRPLPQDPEHDLYFPLDQAALSLVAVGNAMRVDLKTNTPNFETFLARVDGGEWKPTKETFEWKLHPGANRLEAKSLNKFGVEGPISMAELEVSVDGADGKKVSLGAAFAPEQAAAPAPLEPIRTVEIGKNRELRVNGKPFFPLSSWAQASRNYPMLRSLAFNTFTGGNAGMCDAAQKAGGYAMPGFSEAAKAHPALLAQIQGDEPDLNFDKPQGPRRSAESVVEGYQKIKASDNSRPVFMNLTNSFEDNRRDSPEKAAARKAYYDLVVTGCDIVSFDVYPIYGHNFEDKLIWVADGVKKLREYAGPTRPVFCCIETSKGSQWITYERQKDVLPEHTRAEVWMAIIRGATGIIYFTHAWRPEFTEFRPTPEMQQELKRLNEQITRLAPAILGDPARESVSIALSGDLPGEVLAKEYDGSIYLFANNLDMARKSGTATISVAGLKPGTKVEVIDENREIVAGDGKFTDEFGPIAVHLYRIAR